MTDRSIAQPPCPGTATNFVVLIGSPWQCPFGIFNLVNTGGCKIFIHGVDDGGNPISAGFLALGPGEGTTFYKPSDGSAQVVVVCDSSCSGQALLEFDTPNS